jgi:hypothetical protein
VADHTIGELLKPNDGAGVRFTTKQSLGMDLNHHGINGFYRNGRFWSCDMADHWMPHEVTNWTHTAATKEPHV